MMILDLLPFFLCLSLSLSVSVSLLTLRVRVFPVYLCVSQNSLCRLASSWNHLTQPAPAFGVHELKACTTTTRLDLLLHRLIALSFYKIYLFLFSMYGCFTYMHEVPKEAINGVLNLLVLELQMVESNHVDAGNQTWLFCKGQVFFFFFLDIYSGF